MASIPLQPLDTGNNWSAFSHYTFAFSRMLYRGNHVECSLLCLTSFNWQSVLRYALVVVHISSILWHKYASVFYWWTFGSFPVCGYEKIHIKLIQKNKNKAAMHICVQVFTWNILSLVLVKYLRIEWLIYIYHILRNCQTVFVLPSHQDFQLFQILITTCYNQCF